MSAFFVEYAAGLGAAPGRGADHYGFPVLRVAVADRE